MEAENEHTNFPFLSELQSLGEICFPLFRKNDLIGFFILGKKPFENSYSKEELNVLEHAAHYIALSLSITLYNQQLQKEIDLKTKKLKKQNKKMRDILNQQSDFISITSHEIRTPLNVAMVAAEMMKTKASNKADKDMAQSTLAAILKLRDLVQSLFTVQKYDHNNVKLTFQNINLKKFLQGLYEDFQALLKEENKKIDIQLKNKLLADKKIQIDPIKLSQVFNNLVSNSVKSI